MTWIPEESCTLPTDDRPLRAAEFDEMFARHLVEVKRPKPTSAVFVLDGGNDLPVRARDLAARETACCSFFTIDVSEQRPGAVQMHVSVPASRMQIISALIARAEKSASQLRQKERP